MNTNKNSSTAVAELQKTVKEILDKYNKVKISVAVSDMGFFEGSEKCIVNCHTDTYQSRQSDRMIIASFLCDKYISYDGVKQIIDGLLSFKWNKMVDGYDETYNAKVYGMVRKSGIIYLADNIDGDLMLVLITRPVGIYDNNITSPGIMFGVLVNSSLSECIHVEVFLDGTFVEYVYTGVRMYNDNVPVSGVSSRIMSHPIYLGNIKQAMGM